MSRKVFRDGREEIPDCSEMTQEQSEEAKALRRRQLEEALSHQGQFELELDQELLAKLRSMP
jgi:hypothetical protein